MKNACFQLEDKHLIRSHGDHLPLEGEGLLPPNAKLCKGEALRFFGACAPQNDTEDARAVAAPPLLPPRGKALCPSAAAAKTFMQNRQNYR